MVGSRISCYTVLRKLGEGGMGEVFLAHDSRLERRVAIKVLSVAARNDPEARQRFMEEAKAAAAIDHPYVCKVYEVGEEDGQIFIGMEFVEGQTLQQRLERGPLQVPEAIRVGLEICEALAKAHEIGFVHRDLKPSNIMLAADGHVKVMDFGLAKRVRLDADETHVTAVTQTGVLVGTVKYMAPEQLRGAPVDQRSDLFALGIILYEMVTGTHPFARLDLFATALAILGDPPKSFDDAAAPCPAGLAAVIDRLLTKDLEHRYASVREVRSDLERCLHEGDLRVTTVRPARIFLVVLPFVNMGGSKDDEYFSDGITEDIMAHLAKSPELRVIARSSAMSYKGTTKSVEQIGRELNVDAILEGSIRRAGSRVRIVATLVDVKTASQLWSETLDNEMGDILTLQRSVAQQIAAALNASFGPGDQTSGRQLQEEDVEAYQLYLKGRYFLNRLGPEDIQKATRYFNSALGLDPTSARSYAGVATCYATAGHFCYMVPRHAFPRAQAAATRALELNERLPEAHASTGLVKIFYEWDWDGAERAFRRALQLNPSLAEAHTYYSWYLTARNRLSEALTEGQQALDLDPLSLVASTNVGWVLLMGGRCEEALAQFNRTLDLDPDFLFARSLVGYVHLGNQRYAEALEVLKRWRWRKFHIGLAHAFVGDLASARSVIDQGAQLRDTPEYSAMDIGLVYLALGEHDRGFECINEALDNREPAVIYLEALVRWLFPPLRPLLSDPRSVDIFQRLRLRP
jgi:serine/threonine-protein kinase